MASLLTFMLLYGAGLLLTYFTTRELTAGFENKSSLAWYMTTALSFGIFFWTRKKRIKSSYPNSTGYVRSPESDKWLQRHIFAVFSALQIAVYAGSAVFLSNTYWQKVAFATIVILFVMEIVALVITFAQYELKE